MKKLLAVLVTALFVIISCGDDPTLTTPTQNNDDEADTEQTTETDVVTTDEDTNEPEVNEPDEDVPASGCADTMGQNCESDDVCGECMICVSGKCIKGCETDTDCSAYVGTRCNTKLGRCLNPIASGQICSETNCPTGCCYAEKGLSALKCSPAASIATCGMCQQGQVYSPEDQTCISAACSPSTDNCSTLNSGASNAKCYKCQTSEYICKADTSTSGCSAGAVINAAQCVPAGQQCVEGVSECCSGMPCVQGYCY
ncbi:hypothetical protein J6Z19_06700 [bacterium]|nr:hypothetical protein [bacterium]